MLFWLLYHKLYPVWRPLRVFRYLTVRTALASLTALLIVLCVGPLVIRKLRDFQIGQFVREDGPESHIKKSGTPTMGGILIVNAILLPSMLWADWANPLVWIAMASIVLFGAIGFADDYTKIVNRRSLGLTARSKLILQILASTLVAMALLTLQHYNLFSTELSVPFLKGLQPDLLWHTFPATLPHLGFLLFAPFVLWVGIVLIGSSNAVNLTDGLDGLAIGCTIIAAGALTVLTYVSSNVVAADYLGLHRIPNTAELTAFCGSMVGASLGFLWYNSHPAEVFMGDVGSLALGGAIGTVAVMTRQELLLPFIGGVFVLEALSVILQVASYKIRQKRIFRMAPLHHHFEQLGWHESKVIVRFWIAALVFALFALATLKLR